jgi:hypothetical protein
MENDLKVLGFCVFVDKNTENIVRNVFNSKRTFLHDGTDLSSLFDFVSGEYESIVASSDVIHVDARDFTAIEVPVTLRKIELDF